MSDYVTVVTRRSRCPECQRSLRLLIRRDVLSAEAGPAFYICYACGIIGEVAGGTVPAAGDSEAAALEAAAREWDLR